MGTGVASQEQPEAVVEVGGLVLMPPLSCHIPRDIGEPSSSPGVVSCHRRKGWSLLPPSTARVLMAEVPLLVVFSMLPFGSAVPTGAWGRRGDPVSSFLPIAQHHAGCCSAL